MTLVTLFGGGKTHTLTALDHLVTAGEKAGHLDDVSRLLHEAGLPADSTPARRKAPPTFHSAGAPTATVLDMAPCT